MGKKVSTKGILFFCVALILVLVMFYSGFQVLEATVFRNKDVSQEAAQPTSSSKTIVVDEVQYFPRQDITVMMLLGIDQTGPVRATEDYRENGLADVVMLLIFDEAKEECNALYLNRDTMVDIPVVNESGKIVDTFYGQLTLSHLQGSGLEDSCEITRTTVSNFLNGINIDYYAAVNMDGIPIVNDAVGGVTVNVVDDFSAVDPTITKGEIHLWGEQALHFVRYRKNVGDQLNISRMERQREYIDGFLEAFNKKRETGDVFIIKAYEDLSPYLVTDCTLNTVNGLMERYSDYTLNELYVPEGENVLGEKLYEFYVDREKLDELILQLFYAPKK